MVAVRRIGTSGACLAAAILVCLASAASVVAAEATTGPHPWTDKPFIDSGEDFRFAIMSDNTGGARPGVFGDAVVKVNRLRPEFVMCIGDLVAGYEEEQAEIDADYAEFMPLLEPLEMRFFFVPGNHELGNAAMKADYVRRFGGAYYHFVRKNVLFLCLNSQDGEYIDWSYPTGITDEQVEYVKEALEENAGVRWTLVFMHQPLWDEDYTDAGWEKVQALLSDRPHTIFAGHWHAYALYDVDGHKYIRLGTTGGASELTGPLTGKFDHVVWVAMTDGGPEITNIALDGMLAEDVSTNVTQAAYDFAMYGAPVVAGSKVVEEAAVDQVTITITMNNDTDVNMQAHAHVTAGEGLTPKQAEVDAAVPPGSKGGAEIDLQAAEPLSVEKLPAVTIDYSVAFPLPGRETVTAEGTRHLILEGIHEARRLETPIKVDGSLDDWVDLPFKMERPAQVIQNRPKPWNGVDDASMLLGVARDDENLYIAVKAVDDVHFFNADFPVHQCDGVTIIIDPRPRAERATPDKTWESLLVAKLNPGLSPGQERISTEPAMKEGTKVVSVVTESGHNTEMVIPLELIAAAQGGEVKDFRLNIRLFDRDNEEGGFSYLWWRPDWNGGETYVDSGTFTLD